VGIRKCQGDGRAKIYDDRQQATQTDSTNDGGGETSNFMQICANIAHWPLGSFGGCEVCESCIFKSKVFHKVEQMKKERCSSAGKWFALNPLVTLKKHQGQRATDAERITKRTAKGLGNRTDFGCC
jgi:hypothetical protein